MRQNKGIRVAQSQYQKLWHVLLLPPASQQSSSGSVHLASPVFFFFASPRDYNSFSSKCKYTLCTVAGAPPCPVSRTESECEQKCSGCWAHLDRGGNVCICKCTFDAAVNNETDERISFYHKKSPETNQTMLLCCCCCCDPTVQMSNQSVPTLLESCKKPNNRDGNYLTLGFTTKSPRHWPRNWFKSPESYSQILLSPDLAVVLVVR